MSPLTLLLALLVGGAFICALLTASGARVPLWVSVVLLALFALLDLLLK